MKYTYKTRLIRFEEHVRSTLFLVCQRIHIQHQRYLSLLIPHFHQRWHLASSAPGEIRVREFGFDRRQRNLPKSPIDRIQFARVRCLSRLSGVNAPCPSILSFQYLTRATIGRDGVHAPLRQRYTRSPDRNQEPVRTRRLTATHTRHDKMRETRRQSERAVSPSDTAATVEQRVARAFLSLRATATLSPPPPPPPLDTSLYTTFDVTRRAALQRNATRRARWRYASPFRMSACVFLCTCRSLQWPLGIITNGREKRGYYRYFSSRNYFLQMSSERKKGNCKKEIYLHF